MIRLDGHVHIGKVLNSDRSKKNYYITAEELQKFFDVEEITHAAVIFHHSSEGELQRLLATTKVKICALQWIDTYTETISRFANGFKTHMIRGSQIDYVSSIAQKFFKEVSVRMPGAPVLAHTQSSWSLKNRCRPLALATLALKFPELKWVIGHSGAYGFKCYYPTDKSKSGYTGAFQASLSGEILVREAQTIVQRISNVYLDSASLMFVTNKAGVIAEEGRKGKAFLGSDFPFALEIAAKMKGQEEKLVKQFGYTEEEIQRLHQTGLEVYFQ